MQGNASIIRPIPISWAGSSARASEDRSYATETTTAVVRQAVVQRSENRTTSGETARQTYGSRGGATSAATVADTTPVDSSNDDLISAIQRALMSAGIEPQTVSSDALINWLATRIAGSIGQKPEAPAPANHAPAPLPGALLDRIL